MGSHNQRKHQPKQTSSMQQGKWSSVTHELCLKKQEHLAPGDWCWLRCHMLGCTQPSPATGGEGSWGSPWQPGLPWELQAGTGVWEQGGSSRSGAAGADLETALADKRFFQKMDLTHRGWSESLSFPSRVRTFNGFTVFCFTIPLCWY